MFNASILFETPPKIVVSDAQAYRQAGNSIVVDVLMAILVQIKQVVSFEEKISKNSYI